MLYYIKIIVNILFGDVVRYKNIFYVRLIDKERAFSWKAYSQKYGRPYFVILTVIDKH